MREISDLYVVFNKNYEQSQTNLPNNIRNILKYCIPMSFISKWSVAYVWLEMYVPEDSVLHSWYTNVGQ